MGERSGKGKPGVRAARPPAGQDLARQVAYWQRMEEENRQLQERVTAALDDIRAFVGRHRSSLERRKSRLLQTSGFRDETRGIEAALAHIEQLLEGGRNISAIFAAIDSFLQTWNADDTFAREHTRAELAAARERFLGAFLESVRGTKLAELLELLHFLPFSCWGARGVERRNFRSPSAAEVLRVVEELGRRGVDADALDTVQLAAIVRLKLGVTPRMEYHAMPASKLAERLTAEEAIARFASGEVPPDGSFCRAAEGILGNLRRWPAECLDASAPAAPPEIEAEMLQIVALAGDAVRISGTERERAVDYLWVLSTVVAGTRGPLRDALLALDGARPDQARARARAAAAAAWVDGAAALADDALLSRWTAGRQELEALAASAEGIASKTEREFGELSELDRLKERRSDAVKSLIKIAESLQLIEPSLLHQLAFAASAGPGSPALERLRALGPEALRERNRRKAEETRAVARQEFEKLRALIARITTMSRTGAPEAAPQGGGAGAAGRRTADGAELGAMTPAELQAKLLEVLRGAGAAVGEFRGRVEGARKRTFKSDLQHALHVLQEKAAKAADGWEGASLDAIGPEGAPAASDRLAPLLAEIMAAQAKVGARVGVAKLTPAEKQPLQALLHAAKTRIGEHLRDLERVRAELADREGGDEEPPRGADAPRDPQPAAAPDPAPPSAPAPEAEAVSPAARVAALVGAANAGLRPVKELLAGVSRAIAAARHDEGRVREAAQALQRGVTAARDLLTWNRMQIDAIAAEHGLAAGDRADRFGRWQEQLVAAGREADRLLDATEGLAALESELLEAAALEEGIAETVRILSLREVAPDDLVRLRERCLAALATVPALGQRLHGAQERLAAAAQDDWRLLRTAPGYLAARGADVAARAPGLAAGRARIEKVRRLAESQLPPKG